MNELDKLRPEVRDALQVFDGEAVCTCHSAYTSRGLKDPQCNHDLQESVDIIRAELLRLAALEHAWQQWIKDGMRVEFLPPEQPK